MTTPNCDGMQQIQPTWYRGAAQRDDRAELRHRGDQLRMPRCKRQRMDPRARRSSRRRICAPCLLLRRLPQHRRSSLGVDQRAMGPRSQSSLARRDGSISGEHPAARITRTPIRVRSRSWTASSTDADSATQAGATGGRDGELSHSQLQAAGGNLQQGCGGFDVAVDVRELSFDLARGEIARLAHARAAGDERVDRGARHTQRLGRSTRLMTVLAQRRHEGVFADRVTRTPSLGSRVAEILVGRRAASGWRRRGQACTRALRIRARTMGVVDHQPVARSF